MPTDGLALNKSSAGTVMTIKATHNFLFERYIGYHISKMFLLIRKHHSKNTNEISWDILLLVTAFILYAKYLNTLILLIINILHKHTGAIITNGPMGHQLLLYKWDCNPLKDSLDRANYNDVHWMAAAARKWWEIYVSFAYHRMNLNGLVLDWS